MKVFSALYLSIAFAGFLVAGTRNDVANAQSGTQTDLRKLTIAQSGHAHDQTKHKSDGHYDKDGHSHEGQSTKPKKDTSVPEDHAKKDHDHEHRKQTAGNGKDEQGHEEHDEGVKLTPDQMKEFGVFTARVGPGSIAMTITRPAEVKFNENLVAHVVPRVSGIVESALISEGDAVKEGQVIATLDSRELAEAKAVYLAAIERQALAKENYERERTLQRKKITSLKSYSASKTKLAEARIAVRTAEQKLHALGFDEEAVKTFVNSKETNLTRYTMRAPLGGIVIERHLVRGESVKTNQKAFTIVDVSSVWIDISIYPRDLPYVRTGQTILIKTDTGLEVPGEIAFVSPNVSEATRTATARVILNNRKIHLQPGLFVKAIIAISKKAVHIRIPKSALQNQDGKQVAFVSESGKFESRPVKLGLQDGTYAEVISGLKVGETVVVKGAFVIKSQMSKASFGHGHSH